MVTISFGLAITLLVTFLALGLIWTRNDAFNFMLKIYFFVLALLMMAALDAAR